MKSIQFAPKWSRMARLSLALVTVAGSICALAQPAGSPRYTIVDLGPVGPPPGQPYAITGQGLVSGELVLADPAVSHAVLWKQGKMKDIGSPGLGGPNSAAFGANIWGQVVGQADTKTPDPNGEDFCGSKALTLTYSGHTCAPFLWQNGSMIALPRLRSSAGAEGSNGTALKMNDFRLRGSSSSQSSGRDPSRRRRCMFRSFRLLTATLTVSHSRSMTLARWRAAPEVAGPSIRLN